MTISPTFYYLLNLSPLFTGLPALTLTTTRCAQDWFNHTTTGRPEIRATSLAVQKLTRFLWLALTVWSFALNGQTVNQLFFAPVQPHLANNLWRAIGWNTAGAITIVVAVLDIWFRSDIIRQIRSAAIAEVDPIVRSTT